MVVMVSMIMLLLLLVLPSCAIGKYIYVNEKMTIRERGVRIGSTFGFQMDGTLSIHIATTAPSNFTLVFVLIPLTQANVDEYLMVYPNSYYDFCSIVSTIRYEFTSELIVTRKEILYKDLYYALILNCNNGLLYYGDNSNNNEYFYELKGEVVFLNPNNNHLSAQYQPYLTVFGIMWVSYLILFVAWISYVANYRLKSQYVVRHIHDVMAITVFCKFLHGLSFYILLYLQNENGKHNDSAASFLKSADVFSDFSFLSCLVVISQGWGITRFYLMKRELQMLLCCLMLYAIFAIVRVNCPETESYCRGYIFAYYGVRFVLTFFVIVALNANIEALRSRVAYSPSPSLQYKFEIFTDLRVWFVFFLLIPIVILIIALNDQTWPHQYLSYAMEEILIFCIYFLVGYTFRPLANGLDYPVDFNMMQLLQLIQQEAEQNRLHEH